MPVTLPVDTGFPTAPVIKVRARAHYRALMTNRIGRLGAWVGTAPRGSSLALMACGGDVGFLIFYAVGVEGQLSTDVHTIREASLLPSIAPVLSPLK